MLIFLLFPLSVFAGGEKLLLERLLVRFESSALREVVRRAEIPEAVLGRAAQRAEDWDELARVLSSAERKVAGEALDWRLKRVVEEAHWHWQETWPTAAAKPMSQAKFEHLVAGLAGRDLDALFSQITRTGGFRVFAAEQGLGAAERSYEGARSAFLMAESGAGRTIGISVEDASRALRITQAEKSEIGKALAWKQSLDEYQAEFRYLKNELELGDEQLLWRLEMNKTNARELADYARGLRVPRGVNPIHAAVMDKIKWAISNNRMSNPDFVFYVSSMVALEIGAVTLGEVSGRGDDFWKQFDRYSANIASVVLMEIVMRAVTHKSASDLFLAKRVDSGGKLVDYGKRLVRNTVVLGGTQFAFGLLGTGAVELSEAVRERPGSDSVEVSKRLQHVVWNAFLLGAFAATSGNLRYTMMSDVLSLLKGRVPRLLFNVGLAPAAGFLNSRYGSEQYVHFQRWADANVKYAAERLGIRPLVEMDIKP